MVMVKVVIVYVVCVNLVNVVEGEELLSVLIVDEFVEKLNMCIFDFVFVNVIGVGVW